MQFKCVKIKFALGRNIKKYRREMRLYRLEYDLANNFSIYGGLGGHRLGKHPTYRVHA